MASVRLGQLVRPVGTLPAGSVVTLLGEPPIDPPAAFDVVSATVTDTV